MPLLCLVVVVVLVLILLPFRGNEGLIRLKMECNSKANIFLSVSIKSVQMKLVCWFLAR